MSPWNGRLADPNDQMGTCGSHRGSMWGRSRHNGEPQRSATTVVVANWTWRGTASIEAVDGFNGNSSLPPLRTESHASGARVCSDAPEMNAGEDTEGPLAATQCTPITRRHPVD